jgi:hypothetical protein
VTLLYNGLEMSLFHDHQDLYFLQDSALAFETLDKLLAACRRVLDSDLAQGHEIVLDVPGLGLHICEDSIYAPRMTLNEILDSYDHLCHNDDDGDKQPLYCILSTRVSLSAQVAYLNQAGIDGSRYADIAAKYLGDAGTQEDEKNATDRPEDLQTGDDQAENTEELYLEHQEDEVDEQNDEDHAKDGVSAEAAIASEDLHQPASTDISTGAAAGTKQLPAELTFQPDHLHADLYRSDQIDLSDVFDEEDDKLDQAEVDKSHDSHEVAAARTVINVEEQKHETDSSHTMGRDQPGETAEAEVAGGEDVLEGNDDLIDDYVRPSPERLEADENEPTRQSDAIDQYVHDDNDDPETWNTTDVIDRSFDGDILDLDEDELPTTTKASTSATNGESVPPAVSPNHTSAPGNPSPPLTPPSGKSNKRKIEDDEDDEDELLFLDLDTPDPKRVRST